MAIARPMLALISLILVAGGVLLSLFTILSGSVNHLPIDKFYFLETTTNGIPNARNPTRWTYLALCGAVNGRNGDCASTRAALPFDPPRNFGTTENVPDTFIGTHQYYYLSRFMFAFYLISLFFAAIALFSGLLAVCSRLGGYLTSMTVSVALFFQVIASSLQTAWVVKGRDAFRSSGQDAHIGSYLMGFAWAIVACYFLAMVMFCAGGKLGGDRTSTGTGRGFGRKRSTKSTRSRGSFLDTDSQRRVKDDYA